MKRSILKIASLVLVALMALSFFVACDKDNGGADSGIYAIKVGGVTVELGKKADDTLEALGAPLSKQPTGNCGGRGESVEYRYSAFVMGVVDYEDGDSIIDYVELKNDGAETSKGIYIGSSEADVREKYGEPSNVTGGALQYENNDMTLAFGISNGVVVSITMRCI